MEKKDFKLLLDMKKEFEFTFNNKVYNLTYGKDKKGEYILFGLLYEGKKFYSYGELMNEAKIDNYFFREVLDTL